MKNLIIPVAGKSTRYPGMRPKWMLTHPNGEMMLIESIRGLDLKSFTSIYVIVLDEHVKKFGCIYGIEQSFQKLDIFEKLQIIILQEETNSQPETIAAGIMQAHIDGSIFVKDSDNYFKCDNIDKNSICTYNLHKLDNVNPSNKSYISINNRGLIENIIEKKIISSDFCCGGYLFESTELYLKYYNEHKQVPNLYLSHIIFQMLLDRIPFVPIYTEGYQDWGTLEDWNLFKEDYKTFFIDIDGIIVENSAEYFKPYWGETKGIKENIIKINQLFDNGKSEIILVTSRKEEYRDKTIKQLAANKVRYHNIMFGLQHSQRIIINDYSNTNPYKSCEAINIKRNSNLLRDLI